MGADSGVISYKGAGELAAIADVALWITREEDKPDFTKPIKLLVKVKKARHTANDWELRVVFDGANGGYITEDSFQGNAPKGKDSKYISEAKKALSVDSEEDDPWYAK